jgi:uncharacterized protein (UPF0548 family)
MSHVFLKKPNETVLRRFLADQANCKFSYSDVGATAQTTPAGYVVDRTRVLLGSGEAVFRSAQAALAHWQQFRLGWVDVWPTTTPLAAGSNVAVMGRGCGLWWLNACRIVYTVDEIGPVTKFGFAYGTLPSHAERGEERFLLEWHHADDRVWYDILAFSRPNYWATWLGYPVVRRLQKRFGQHSAAAMRCAVAC